MLAHGCPQLDINDDGDLVPQDALIWANNWHMDGGGREVDFLNHPFDLAADVNQDGRVTTTDWFFLIDGLNGNPGIGPYDLGWCLPEVEVDLIVKDMGIGDTTVSSAKSVSVLTFEGVATGGDALLTEIIVGQFYQGGTLTDAAQQVLWVDTDRNGETDTILDRTADGVFDAGFVLEEGLATLFQIKIDVASTITGPALQFDLDAAAAENLDDGSSVPVQFVFGQNEFVLRLEDQGEVLIFESTTPRAPRYHLGGAEGTSILDVSFQSASEAGDVTVLGFEGNAGARSIDRLNLRSNGELIGTASRAMANALGLDVHFAVSWQSQQFVIDEQEERTIFVHPVIESDEQGGVSGDVFSVELVHVEARGLVSSNDIQPELIGTIASGDHTVVMAKIASVENANPDANGTTVPTGTNRDIGQFKYIVAAGLANTLGGLNDVIPVMNPFDVESSNVLFDPNGFFLYNKSNATERIPCQSNGSSGNVRVTCVSSNNPSVDMEIDQGQSISLSLSATILNSQIQSSQGSRLKVFADIGESGIEWLDQDNLISVNFKGLRLGDQRVGSTEYRI